MLSAFLIEFQGVIRNMVALSADPHPTPAQHFEVKERFTGLITDGASQQALLVEHLQPVLRQLIANQMKRGLLDGFPVLLALQDLVDAYSNSRSALTMQQEKDNITSWPHSGSRVALARKFFHSFFSLLRG